jgi:hypothetical protein
MTLEFTAKSLDALIEDIRNHYNDDALRRRTLALTEGYYLSILTGSHSYLSVEIALMKDGHFVDSDDFAIIDFYDCDKAIKIIQRLSRYFEADDAIDIWDYIHTKKGALL